MTVQNKESIYGIGSSVTNIRDLSEIKVEHTFLQETSNKFCAKGLLSNVIEVLNHGNVNKPIESHNVYKKQLDTYLDKLFAICKTSKKINCKEDVYVEFQNAIKYMHICKMLLVITKDLSENTVNNEKSLHRMKAVYSSIAKCFKKQHAIVVKLIVWLEKNKDDSNSKETKEKIDELMKTCIGCTSDLKSNEYKYSSNVEDLFNNRYSKEVRNSLLNGDSLLHDDFVINKALKGLEDVISTFQKYFALNGDVRESSDEDDFGYTSEIFRQYCISYLSNEIVNNRGEAQMNMIDAREFKLRQEKVINLLSEVYKDFETRCCKLFKASKMKMPKVKFAMSKKVSSEKTEAVGQNNSVVIQVK